MMVILAADGAAGMLSWVVVRVKKWLRCCKMICWSVGYEYLALGVLCDFSVSRCWVRGMASGSHSISEVRGYLTLMSYTLSMDVFAMGRHSISKGPGYLMLMWYTLTLDLGNTECNGGRMVSLVTVTNR